MNFFSSPAALVWPVRRKGGTRALRVEVVDNAAALTPHLDAWEALAARALTPNPFYEPWLLLPAMRHLEPASELLFALVHDEARPSQLCGFFPLRVRTRFKGLPVRVLELWKHPHCFLCTPLLDADRADDALTAFFDWARSDPRGSALIDMPQVNGAGPFQQIVTEVCGRLGLSLVLDERHERALLEPALNAETYLANALSTGNRKELRRQRRRLAELGRLETRALHPGDDVDPWVHGFLDLEASGWKGHEATALASDAGQRDFFASMVREGAARGRVALLGLFLDDKPIALKCNLLSPPGAFAFKIAYAEVFARFSPGTQLELDNVRWLHGQRELQWMDSCAVARHFMIERLWRERRAVQSLWVSTGRWTGNLLLAGLPLARATRRWIRSATS